MTADDIRSQRFSTRFIQGFSPEEVSAFLEDVAEAFDEIQKTATSLTVRVKELETELPAAAPRPPSAPTHLEVLRSAALQEVEALLHDAQAQAQAIVEGARELEAAARHDAEAVRARLQAEGEEVVAVATARAEAIIATARAQEASIRDDIDRLTQSRVQLVDEIRGALDTYHGWLATVDPRGRARGRREAHEVSNGDGQDVGAPDEARAI